MEDRRKTPYCSPAHKLIPTLVALSDHIKGIHEAAGGMNCLNYSGRATLIQALAENAVLEVNKLCMRDIEDVQQKEKQDGS